MKDTYEDSYTTNILTVDRVLTGDIVYFGIGKYPDHDLRTY